jgi:hypothetical protein
MRWGISGEREQAERQRGREREAQRENVPRDKPLFCSCSSHALRCAISCGVSLTACAPSCCCESPSSCAGDRRRATEADVPKCRTAAGADADAASRSREGGAAAVAVAFGLPQTQRQTRASLAAAVDVDVDVDGKATCLAPAVASRKGAAALLLRRSSRVARLHCSSRHVGGIPFRCFFPRQIPSRANCSARREASRSMSMPALASHKAKGA